MDQMKVVIRCPNGSDGKASACNDGDPGLIPGSGRSPGEGNGNPLHHSCLENPMDGEVHGVAKSQTQLSNFTFTLLNGSDEICDQVQPFYLVCFSFASACLSATKCDW